MEQSRNIKEHLYVISSALVADSVINNFTHHFWTAQNTQHRRMYRIKQFIFLVTLMFFDPESTPIDDRLCGTNLSRLWLDIIFIVDNSYSSNTSFIYDKIDSFFPLDVQIGTAYDDPRSTRIGILLSGKETTVETELNSLQSRDDLTIELNRLRKIPTDQTSKEFLDDPLNATLYILSETEGFRDNYKKMVVLFTNAFHSFDPQFYTDKLQKSGVKIATVNMFDASYDEVLRSLSSPGMAFKSSDGNLTEEMQNAMTSTNCHCPNDTIQYSIKTDSVPKQYGVCISSKFRSQSWHSSQYACHREGKYLTTEFTKQKRQFNMGFMNQGQRVNAYFNGLFEQNGIWVWDQPLWNQTIPLDPSSGTVSFRSGCVADMKLSDGTVSWTPISCANNFPSICEMAACDTDHYCDQ